MLHSRKLIYIDEIARCGSIRKAAARLNVASSAINRQILALEEELGAPIFERMPRGLKLTAAGELLIEHIRDVLKTYERMDSRIRGLKMPQVGKVSIVTTVGLASGILPEITARFVAQHPRVHIHLRSDSGSTTIQPVVAGEDAIELAQLVQEPLVLAQPGTSLRNVINLTLAHLPMAVEPVVETNASDMLKHLVKCGTGLTLLNPLDVLPECRRGELVFRPLAGAHARHQPMKLFARSRSTLDTATSLFIEFLLTELATIVAELQEKGHLPSHGHSRVGIDPVGEQGP
eukprot:g7624.t1